MGNDPVNPKIRTASTGRPQGPFFEGVFLRLTSFRGPSPVVGGGFFMPRVGVI